MFSTESRDELIAQEEKRFEELNLAFDSLLKDLNLTREQLQAFLNDSKQFTVRDQQEITSLRASLDERLEGRLAKVPKVSPNQTRNSLASIKPTWIFVR